MSDPKFVDAGKRAISIKLEYPVSVGEKVISTVEIRRLSRAEVVAWMEAQSKSDEALVFPGLSITNEELAMLDDDDATAVEECLQDFLPRRLKAALGQTSATGEDSQQS